MGGMEKRGKQGWTAAGEKAVGAPAVCRVRRCLRRWRKTEGTPAVCRVRRCRQAPGRLRDVRSDRMYHETETGPVSTGGSVWEPRFPPTPRSAEVASSAHPLHHVPRAVVLSGQEGRDKEIGRS